MSLYLRKLAARAIQDSQSPLHHLPSADFQEEQILNAMELGSTDPNAALGSLTVICADLLEAVRRTDPAYELQQKHYQPRHGEGYPSPYFSFSLREGVSIISEDVRNARDSPQMKR